METKLFAWFNGSFCNPDVATVSLMQHALHYGTGAFEGIRRVGNYVLKLPEHVSRLQNGCKTLDLPWIFPPGYFEKVILEVARLNGGNEEIEYYRPIMWWGDGTLGVGLRGNKANYAVLPYHMGEYLGSGAKERGVDTIVSKWRSVPRWCQPTDKVTGSYYNRFLAKQEARNKINPVTGKGYDEAIMLFRDEKGQEWVSEGSGENIFREDYDGVIYTPTETAGILKGITRDAVIKEIGPHVGFEIKEEDFDLDSLLHSRGAFFTGTAAGITPIKSVNNVVLGDGHPTEMTRKIMEVYDAATSRKIPKFHHWLTAIPYVREADIDQLVLAIS